jgi:hypothetical protein
MVRLAEPTHATTPLTSCSMAVEWKCGHPLMPPGFEALGAAIFSFTWLAVGVYPLVNNENIFVPEPVIDEDDLKGVCPTANGKHHLLLREITHKFPQVSSKLGVQFTWYYQPSHLLTWSFVSRAHWF